MKCALITGASRGIGRAAALRLAEDGSYPLLCLTAFQNEELLQTLADEIHDRYPEQSVLLSTGDIGDPDYVTGLCGKLHETGGNVSLLINNAGIADYGLLMDLSPEKWDRILRTDLTGLFNTCRTFQPDLLKAEEGRIINLSSVWGAVGASCEVAYSAAKGGVEAFTRALARELAPSHVAVNCLQPGAVDTDMNRHLDPDEKEALEKDIPYGRFASPEEIAEALLLLSKMPLYVTGAMLRMDGGWM